MKINYSRALRLFKKEVGNANHMLITILVGLDAIVDYDVELRPEFRVSWNPRDKSKSAERSKEFAKKASLVWMVDCLDMYLRLINRSPSIIFDENFKNQIDGESKSVYKKASIVADFCGMDDSIEYAMVDLMISWRNNLTHFDIDNKIRDASKNILLEKKDIIRDVYRHLDVEKMLESFYTKKIPTFKETASLFKSLIDFVYNTDEYFIDNLDEVFYADRILIHYISENPNVRIDNVFSKDKLKKEHSLIEILKHYGFSQDNESSSSEELGSFCRNVAQMTAKTAKKCFERRSFVGGF